MVNQYGLSSGVMLMNLSRINYFPGGFLNAIKKADNLYGHRVNLGDQDLLNVVFSKVKLRKSFYRAYYYTSRSYPPVVRVCFHPIFIPVTEG